jgi:hypothetical protein
MMANPGDPNSLVADSVKYLFTLPLTQATMDQIKKDILLSGQTTDAYWTTAWTTFLSNPTNTANATIVKTRLASLYQYLTRLSEHQLS